MFPIDVERKLKAQIPATPVFFEEIAATFIDGASGYRRGGYRKATLMKVSRGLTEEILGRIGYQYELLSQDLEKDGTVPSLQYLVPRGRGRLEHLTGKSSHEGLWDIRVNCVSGKSGEAVVDLQNLGFQSFAGNDLIYGDIAVRRSKQSTLITVIGGKIIHVVQLQKDFVNSVWLPDELWRQNVSGNVH